jgi:hypothetical protein
MNDFREIKAGDIVEYGEGNMAQVKKIRISPNKFYDKEILVDNFNVETKFTLATIIMQSLAIKIATEANVQFILNNGMYKNLKQIQAAYRKNTTTGDIEKVYDKDSYTLYKKLGG